MPTKRLTGFAVAAALCGGCGTFADQRTEAVNPATHTQTKPTISVGQSFDEAKNLLLEAGAKDITYAIQIIIGTPEGQPRRELYWFKLRDGKWLSVQVMEAGEPKQLVLEMLVLGDKNTEHIKFRGLRRYPEITRLELP